MTISPDATTLDELAVQTETKAKRPSMYRVLLLNDDFTPMEFVVSILERVFHKTQQESVEIMMQVHHKGVACAGIYTYEVAETMVNKVIDLANKGEHPLQCTMEKDGA